MPRWSKSFLFRLMISYVIFAVLLVGTAGGYLYNRANAMMIEEMSKDSRYTLDKIMDYMGDTLLRKFENTFVTKAMTTVNPDSADALKVLLANDSSADYMYEIMNLVNELGAITEANEGLDGVTIYYKQAGYVIDQTYYYQSPDKFPDYTFLRSLDETAPYQWFNRIKGGTGEAVLTYVYTLPYKFIPRYTQGYLYIDISLKHLANVIHHFTSSPNDKLLVFDESGQLILPNEPVDAKLSKLIDDTLLLRKQTDFSIMKDPANKNIIAYLPGSVSPQGWGYVLVKPMTSFYLMTEKLKNDIIWICSAILTLGLLSSYIVSNRFNLPLKRLILRIGSRSGSISQLRTGNNEYSVIHSFIQDTDEKLLQLQTQVYGKNLLNLIHGNIDDIDDLTGIPKYERYIPVHVKNRAGSSHALNAVFDKKSAHMPFDLVTLNMHETALLFYSNDKEPEAAAQAVFDEVNRYIRSCSGTLQIAVGIGDAVHAAEHIHQAYAHAEYAGSYSFIFGYPAIIPYRAIMERRPLHIPFAVEPYYNALRAGDLQNVKPMIDKYAEELAAANITVESLEVNIMQFVTALSVFIIDHDLQQLVPVNKLFADAVKPTFEETWQWIGDINGQITAHYSQRSTNAHMQLIHDLKRYIDEHYEEDISLDLLADKSGLSPNYVSVLFKETLHLPVIEYVHKVRLEKAAALLQETNATVTEIAERVGYRYSQYFCRKFKGKYGVTPIQYRQSGIGE